jgi:hypothetical protein
MCRHTNSWFNETKITTKISAFVQKKKNNHHGGSSVGKELEDRVQLSPSFLSSGYGFKLVYGNSLRTKCYVLRMGITNLHFGKDVVTSSPSKLGSSYGSN